MKKKKVQKRKKRTKSTESNASTDEGLSDDQSPDGSDSDAEEKGQKKKHEKKTKSRKEGDKKKKDEQEHQSDETKPSSSKNTKEEKKRSHKKKEKKEKGKKKENSSDDEDLNSLNRQLKEMPQFLSIRDLVEGKPYKIMAFEHVNTKKGERIRLKLTDNAFKDKIAYVKKGKITSMERTRKYRAKLTDMQIKSRKEKDKIYRRNKRHLDKILHVP
ncbi:nucleolar protein 58-like [Thrips palmi]|uniref:Nucleolar protein 58-like n=1 Tax=Thrips palmi TaxID=161013 RepID=A0A6P8YQ26_THRPL|nr:nucleolar protein 58-like [Thrips palmi]